MPRVKDCRSVKFRCLLASIWLALAFGCASTPRTPAPTPPTSATVGTTTILAIAPPAGSGHGMSLPKFLGLPEFAQGVGGVLQRVGSRLLNGLDLTGRFPALQPQPPIVPLSDPANLKPDAPPAVQAAAEIKGEEDAAPQKIMAIRYLATLGCGGCYEKVENALLEALNDCTEEVRFEAANALSCKPECACRYCYSTSCCSAKVRKKLEELSTCEKEPSPRVRRQARLSLACCAGVPLNVADDEPREGPAEQPPEPASEVKPSVFTVDHAELQNSAESLRPASSETILASSSLADSIRATVNGEQIMQSQIVSLMEESLRRQNRSSLQSMDENERRNLTLAELGKFIEWKLLEQFARLDVYSVTSTATTISPEEIQSWIGRKIVFDTNIQPQHILAYYEINKQRYRVPARLRWERLSVIIDRCNNREHANTIMQYLRIRALGGSTPPPEEFTREAVESQSYDWMDLMEVESAAMQSILVDLPIGKLSHTMEHNHQLHLVRVLERTPADYLPLPVVADRIRSEILSERRELALAQFISQLRSQSQIRIALDPPSNSNKTNFESLAPGALRP